MTSLTIIEADVMDGLAQLEDGSVHCVVTSPPYWGLRDYGTAAQIGLEPTPEAYVAHLVAVFREVRRVLRDDGTVFLNLGDSYASRDNSAGRNRRDVWTIPTQPFPGAHFATFPEALVKPCILAGSPEGGTVLDIFAGSGTVGVVAQKAGRKAILIDLNPAYCDMMRERLSQRAFL